MLLYIPSQSNKNKSHKKTQKRSQNAICFSSKCFTYEHPPTNTAAQSPFAERKADASESRSL